LSGSDLTRENDFKLKERRFRLDISRNFVTQRMMVRLWPRLPREAVKKFPIPASLAVFKARLD